MTSLMNRSITILRASDDGEFVEGLYQPSERTTITIQGSIQPDNKDRQAIAVNQNPSLQGKDKEGCIILFTKSELKTVENTSLKNADIVYYNTLHYKIMSSSGLRELGPLSHYKYSAEYIKDIEI